MRTFATAAILGTFLVLGYGGPLALTLGACSSVDPLIVTGKSVEVMGNTFAETAAAMDVALDAHTISVEQYRGWAAFGRSFQASYLHLVSLWQIAKDTRDAKLEAEVAGILARLASELAAWHVSGPDGGR